MRLLIFIITNLVAFEVGISNLYKYFDYSARGVFYQNSHNIFFSHSIYLKRSFVTPIVAYSYSEVESFSGNTLTLELGLRYVVYPATLFFVGYELDFSLSYSKGWFGGLRRADFIERGFLGLFKVSKLINRNELKFGFGFCDYDSEIINIDEFYEAIFDKYGNKVLIKRESGFKFNGVLESFLFSIEFKRRFFHLDFKYWPNFVFLVSTKFS
ncbi:MAG: hypothetical protein NZ870_04095, partial [bacterium]|nr:hypothetical protein [bacterium]